MEDIRKIEMYIYMLHWTIYLVNIEINLFFGGEDLQYFLVISPHGTADRVSDYKRLPERIQIFVS